MKKSTAEKSESAKSELKSNRLERDKLAAKTYLFFIGEYRRKYPKIDGENPYEYHSAYCNYADNQQAQNSARLECLLENSLVLRNNIKKWRGENEQNIHNSK